jgi:hypothetical protein
MKQDGTTVGAVFAEAKEFKTGSTGFFGTGKAVIGDKKYQVSVTMVEIGSGPKKEEAVKGKK